MPLDYGYPMQIFPGVSFHYGMCAKGTPSAHLRVDLMSVPSLRRDNASAYAIHIWSKVRARAYLKLPPLCVNFSALQELRSCMLYFHRLSMRQASVPVSILRLLILDSRQVFGKALAVTFGLSGV